MVNAGGGEMGREPVRLRMSVADVAALRERLLMDGADARLRWSDAEGRWPAGSPVEIEVEVRADGEDVTLRGRVDAIRAGEAAGVWLRIPNAAALLESCEIGLCRRHRRMRAEHLALVSGAGGEQLLCRVRDLSEGGMRILISAAQSGPIGTILQVVLPEAGHSRSDVELRARVAWTRQSEVGVQWIEPCEAARAGIARLVRIAAKPWQLALVG